MSIMYAGKRPGGIIHAVRILRGGAMPGDGVTAVTACGATLSGERPAMWSGISDDGAVITCASCRRTGAFLRGSEAG